MTIHSVMDDMPDRLVAAQDDVNSKRVSYEHSCQLRNRLVVTAVDGGMSQHQVAQLLGIGQPAVNKILAKPDSYDPPAAAA